MTTLLAGGEIASVVPANATNCRPNGPTTRFRRPRKALSSSENGQFPISEALLLRSVNMAHNNLVRAILIRAISLSLAALLWPAAVLAQTQASCTFTPLSNVLLAPGFPAGINDFGTVVGAWDTGEDNPVTHVAFVRWANGGLSFPLGKNVNSQLANRTDAGASVGELETNTGTIPILLNGKNVTDVTINGLARPQIVSGINGWGTIVGMYFASQSGFQGFKRWSNGGFIKLSFPGAVETRPTGINDSGTIVGSYSPSLGALPKGFVYYGGSWATLNFPNSTTTSLVGINNAGIIIGNALVSGYSTAFLYENGVFKVISPPGSAAGETFVLGASPRLGLIVGTPDDFETGFIARCE